MAPTKQQHPVQQLTTDRADPPLGDRVRSWCPHRRPHRIRLPSEAKTASKGSVNLASRSRSRNLNCSLRSARSMRRLRACWATHSPVGLADTPRMWTLRVETSSTNSSYRRLGSTVSAWKKSQPRTPLAWAARNCCQVRLARRGAGSIPARLRSSHRARCDLASKPGELTVDAPISPGRVLGCHPQDQAAQLRHHRGPAGLAARINSSGAGPARDATAAACPAPPADVAGAALVAGGSTPRARPGLARSSGPADLSAQHRHLVAQDKDLGVLGCLLSSQQSEPAEELTEDQVEESEAPSGDLSPTSQRWPNGSRKPPWRCTPHGIS